MHVFHSLFAYSNSGPINYQLEGFTNEYDTCIVYACKYYIPGACNASMYVNLNLHLLIFQSNSMNLCTT